MTQLRNTWTRKRRSFEMQQLSCCCISNSKRSSWYWMQMLILRISRRPPICLSAVICRTVEPMARDRVTLWRTRYNAARCSGSAVYEVSVGGYQLIQRRQSRRSDFAFTRRRILLFVSVSNVPCYASACVQRDMTSSVRSALGGSNPLLTDADFSDPRLYFFAVSQADK